MRHSILSTVAATILAGTHMAQFYLPHDANTDQPSPEPIQYYGPRQYDRPPRLPPYEYYRPYSRRDEGWMSPQEQEQNWEMRRFRFYEERRHYNPYRPY